MKNKLIIGLLVISLVLIAGCNQTYSWGDESFEPYNKSSMEIPEPLINDATICCHSFGYGNMMERCCDEYEWTLPDECIQPKEMVGGDKEIVEDSYCQTSKT